MLRLVASLLLVVTLASCKSKEEKLQAAEDTGNTLAATKARLVKGVGEALQKEGKEAAEKVTQGVGEVVKGVGSGVEKGLLEVKLDVQKELGPKGLSATRATRGDQGASAHAVSIYLVLEKPLKTSLELRAFDEQDREVGRTQVALDEAKSTARYVDFAFDPRTPLLTVKRFELRDGAASP
jgi:hypothetical protein